MDQVVFSVPCGNFGHLVSGILAKKMGLPIYQFVATTNINDEVPQFIRTGEFHPHAAFQTIAVSMDVGNPSNFPRLLELYQNSLNSLHRDIIPFSFMDEEIREGICKMEKETGYLLDPHSSTAYLGMQCYRKLIKNEIPIIFFETAHPAKFIESVQPLTSRTITIPKEIENACSKEEHFISMDSDFSRFKEFLKNSSR